MARTKGAPALVTVSMIADQLELPATGRARVYQTIRRLGIEPEMIAGRAALYPSGTVAKIRKALGAAEGVQ